MRNVETKGNAGGYEVKNILEELCALRRRDAEIRESAVPFAEMMKNAESARKPHDFISAFRRERTSQDTKINIIAELKKASPSEGVIREGFHPVELAGELESAGAAALSVLCEPHRFLGSEDYLAAVRKISSLPLLYKDFITTPYQIAAARAAGADAVLLIAAVLDDKALVELLEFTHSLGIKALVETHDKDEISKAIGCGAQIIGVNCRDLRNFSTDVSLLEKLLGDIPAECIRIAESGMHTREAVRCAKNAGADGFLVGTALMRAPSPGEKLSTLI